MRHALAVMQQQAVDADRNTCDGVHSIPPKPLAYLAEREGFEPSKGF